MAHAFNIKAGITDVLKECGRASYTQICRAVDGPPQKIKSILYRWEEDGVIVRHPNNEYSIAPKR